MRGFYLNAITRSVYDAYRINHQPHSGNGRKGGPQGNRRRGNQQISPDVIRRAGKKNIIIVSTPTKLAQTGTLSVDTGDPELDSALSGFMRVIVSRHETKLAKIV